MLYILDTDHLSLLQNGHPTVSRRLLNTSPENLVTTTVSLAEQLQGRLAVINRAKSESSAAYGFKRLQETVLFYQTLPQIAYDERAAAKFEARRKQKIRIGTQDLRIASIALVHGATVVTRNLRDFSKVPNLDVVDWSVQLENGLCQNSQKNYLIAGILSRMCEKFRPILPTVQNCSMNTSFSGARLMERHTRCAICASIVEPRSRLVGSTMIVSFVPIMRGTMTAMARVSKSPNRHI